MSNSELKPLFVAIFRYKQPVKVELLEHILTVNLNITRCITTQDMTSKMEVDSVNFPEVDELEDEFESEDEDANPDAFRIHEPLQPPQATLFTTQTLHSMLGLS